MDTVVWFHQFKPLWSDEIVTLAGPILILKKPRFPDMYFRE